LRRYVVTTGAGAVAMAVALTVATVGPGLAVATPSRPGGAHRAAPRIVGTWANDQSGSTQLSGGYELWSNGKVVALDGAQYLGDAAGAGQDDFVGMVTDFWSAGYWLVTSTGRVYAYGKVCQDQALVRPRNVPSYGIIGAINLANSVDEGFDLVGANGAVYQFQCG
jgi:hypothetical protein